MTSVLRRAALAACLSAAALAPATPAFAIGGGFNPVTTPPTFPGTTTPIDGWKLSGIGAATSVQVAPRWLITSAHSPMMPGWTYTSPMGVQSKVIDQVSLAQTSPDGPSDIAISLLETPIAAPTGGFPLLLTDAVSLDLDASLPGYVLWAGGAYAAKPVPSVGWARPDAAPYAGSTRLSLQGGDSGSTGLLYRTATARPVMSGVTKSSNSETIFGGDTRFSYRLSPSATESFATVTDWAKAKFALHPEATPPTFSTFAGAGIALSGLKPPAPRDFDVAAATATSVTVKWTASPEKRIPLTGYRLRNLTTGQVVTVDSAKRAHTFTGLAVGKNYTFSVKSFNSKGESPLLRGFGPGDTTLGFEPDRVSYLVRANPAAPQGLTVTTQRASGTSTGEWGGGKPGVDYCATASWAPVAPPAGATITRYETTLGGKVLPAPTKLGVDVSATPGADGRISIKRCGLAPAALQAFSVRAFSDVNAGPSAAASATTPVGAPGGTPLAGPVMTATPRVTSFPGYLEYCVKATWQAPAAVAGFPITAYGVDIISADYEYQKAFRDLGTSVRSQDVCGLEPGQQYTVKVRASYDGIASGLTEAQAELPAGAAQGSTIPQPTNVTVKGAAANTAGKVDYCVTVEWDQPAALEGFPVRSFGLLINSDDYEYVKGLSDLYVGSGRRTVEHCGLKPGQGYEATVFVKYDSHTVGSISNSSDIAVGATPAGAAPGTTWTLPTAVATTATRTATGICATTTWQAPADVAGFPVTGYGVLITTESGGYLAASPNLSSSARSATICGLKASASLKASVYAVFTPSVFTVGDVRFTTPA